jgi:hypothetical protein
MSVAQARMENRCRARHQLRRLAYIVTLLAIPTACSDTDRSTATRENSTPSASSATSSSGTTFTNHRSTDEVGPPLVTGKFEARKIPDPDCSPRADAETLVSVESDTSLETGLRNAIRQHPLPQEGLLHAYLLDTPTRRVYVAAETGIVTAVVTMTLHSNDDGTLQAWIADRSISCL